MSHSAKPPRTAPPYESSIDPAKRRAEVQKAASLLITLFGEAALGRAAEIAANSCIPAFAAEVHHAVARQLAKSCV